MKLVLDQPCMCPFDPLTDVRVLIACADSTAAGQACAVLEQIGCNCEPEGRLIYQWWNFEVLTITALRELASREAAKADLIIIVAHDGGTLPQEVTDWITRWLDLRQARPGALVALLDSDVKDADDSPGLFSQLRESAALGRMDFFMNRSHGEVERGDDARVIEATRQFVMATTRRRNPGCRTEVKPAAFRTKSQDRLRMQ